MFLGAANAQVPVIKYAKQQGYYVITADYLPENPGHMFSDEYYNVSTTDKDEVLKLAKQLGIDAISAYASDPSAPTAAYVCDELQLVGSSYESVNILSDKTLFRRFLSTNGHNCPWYYSGSEPYDLLNKYSGGKAILKPVDSSGSKGIHVIESTEDILSEFDQAKLYSRTGRVILEQFIEKKGPQIHGEGFVINGKVIFLHLGDQYFSTVNNLIPYSTIVRSTEHEDIMPLVYKKVKEVIDQVGFNTGGINVEVMRDINDEIYILEIGARNGGNFMPQLMKHATGFDLVKANVDALFEIDISFNNNIRENGQFAQLILHSNKDGVFKGLNIPGILKDRIYEQVLYYKEGEKINKYRSSRDVVGVIIFKLVDDREFNCYQLELKKNNWIYVE